MSTDQSGKTYDVVIIGGGPGGSTLAARLARELKLSVAVFESEKFPREHIGETLVPSVVTALQESGALSRVLASDCWIRKSGGYYAWDGVRPWATLFEHEGHLRDGYLRWAFHVNRAMFDQILLDHAADCGVHVRDGTPVLKLVRRDGYTEVLLPNNEVVRAHICVNASGRYSISTLNGPKEFLSTYKNIAIWGYVRGGRPAQSLPGDWNVFRERDLSPVGSFAFEDGWFWYIPIPMLIDGKLERVHSLGVVTAPRALSTKRDYTQMPVFMEAARQVPFLGELLQDATPVDDQLRTTTNYSRISDEMCNWPNREIRVGDAAFFVDPLFSTGVHFALQHASAAVLLIKAAYDAELSDEDKSDLWQDYDQMLRQQANSFALSIDQWYHEIALSHPNSAYWTGLGGEPTFKMRRATFHFLVNGSLDEDLLQVISKGQNRIDALGQDGPWIKTQRLLASALPEDHVEIRLASDVTVRGGMSLERPLTDSSDEKLDQRPQSFAFGPYWLDPEAHAHEVAPRFGHYRRCLRFERQNEDKHTHVRFLGDERDRSLIDLFSRVNTFGKLREELSPRGRTLLERLLVAGMMVGKDGQSLDH
jgi:flavin-dependent dehydrogenase